MSNKYIISPVCNDINNVNAQLSPNVSHTSLRQDWTMEPCQRFHQLRRRSSIRIPWSMALSIGPHRRLPRDSRDLTGKIKDFSLVVIMMPGYTSNGHRWRSRWTHVYTSNTSNVYWGLGLNIDQSDQSEQWWHSFLGTSVYFFSGWRSSPLMMLNGQQAESSSHTYPKFTYSLVN